MMTVVTVVTVVVMEVAAGAAQGVFSGGSASGYESKPGCRGWTIDTIICR